MTHSLPTIVKELQSESNKLNMKCWAVLQKVEPGTLVFQPFDIIIWSKNLEDIELWFCCHRYCHQNSFDMIYLSKQNDKPRLPLSYWINKHFGLNRHFTL